MINPSVPPYQIGRWSNDRPDLVDVHRDLGVQLLRAIEEYQPHNGGLRVIIGDHALALIMIHVLSLPFIFDGIDSNALYFLRRARSLAMRDPLRALNSLAWWHTYRSVEGIIARHAALYVVPARADESSIRAACPNARVLTIPNGTHWIDQPPVEPYQHGQAPMIAFHGGMTWEPNRASASYLATKVFPLVRRAIPQAILRIAGGPVPSGFAALARQPGVEVAGFVPDIRRWLSSCSVYAMPMTQGSGVKNKLIEAMAAGLPVVTNSLGAEALPDSCRKAVVVADGHRKLARAIIELLRDPARCATLRVEARSAAEREFAWGVLAARYREAIQTVGQSRRLVSSVRGMRVS
jgi:glycosyltransferase involved in cell wall biosynthesis